MIHTIRPGWVSWPRSRPRWARILAGARTAFARKGMAATMADVAAAAGVSQGLPYRYFSDKNGLVRARVAEAVQQAAAEGSPLA